MNDPNEAHAAVYVILGLVWLAILFLIFWVIL
jgi:hypothetical protein